MHMEAVKNITETEAYKDALAVGASIWFCKIQFFESLVFMTAPFNDLPHNLIIPAPFNFATTF